LINHRLNTRINRRNSVNRINLTYFYRV